MNKNPGLMQSQESPGVVNDIDWKSWDEQDSLWTSHIGTPLESTNWWTVCGGAEQSASTTALTTAATRTAQRGGYVAAIHAPTRSLAVGSTTREAPTQFAFTDSCMSTVGNESVVSHWSHPGLERTNRNWCSPPCAYAVAYRKDGWLAVGGVGGAVDIFQQPGTRSFSVLAG